MNPFDYDVKRYNTEFKRKRLEAWHATYWDTTVKKARFDQATKELPKGIKHDNWVAQAYNSTKKGVYVWGPPGTGKSQIMRELTGGYMYLVPNAGKRFALATCKSKENAIVFDDFDELLEYRKIINNLTDDYAVATAERKCGSSFIVTANRVIITSNNPPPAWWGFERRFEIIETKQTEVKRPMQDQYQETKISCYTGIIQVQVRRIKKTYLLDHH